MTEEPSASTKLCPKARDPQVRVTSTEAEEVDAILGAVDMTVDMIAVDEEDMIADMTAADAEDTIEADAEDTIEADATTIEADATTTEVDATTIAADVTTTEEDVTTTEMDAIRSTNVRIVALPRRPSSATEMYGVGDAEHRRVRAHVYAHHREERYWAVDGRRAVCY